MILSQRIYEFHRSGHVCEIKHAQSQSAGIVHNYETGVAVTDTELNFKTTGNEIAVCLHHLFNSEYSVAR